MRYGLARSLAIYLHLRLPNLAKRDFDELTVRRFIGETALKIGSMIFLIAMVGVFKPESFNLAIIVGWICVIILAIGSVTFFEKINLWEKYKQARAEKRQQS
jgi:F0F1-type ATP synthase assembly protein I